MNSEREQPTLEEQKKQIGSKYVKQLAYSAIGSIALAGTIALGIPFSVLMNHNSKGYHGENPYIDLVPVEQVQELSQERDDVRDTLAFLSNELYERKTALEDPSTLLPYRLDKQEKLEKKALSPTSQQMSALESLTDKYEARFNELGEEVEQSTEHPLFEEYERWEANRQDAYNSLVLIGLGSSLIGALIASCGFAGLTGHFRDKAMKKLLELNQGEQNDSN